MDTYEEKVLKPVKIEAIGTELAVTNEDGASYSTSDSSVIWRLLRFYQKYTPYNAKELVALKSSELSAILTEAAATSGRTLKALLDSDGNVVNFVSQIHKQVDRTQALTDIEKSLLEVFGEEIERQELRDNLFSYSLPIKNKYVNSNVGVDLGSNRALGRSSIAIFGRFQTKTPFGISAPCLNWSRIWGAVTSWFGIEVKRLSNLSSVIGAEKAEPFYLREIHTANHGIPFEVIKTHILALKEGLESIEVVFEQAVKSRLTTPEMRDILEAYQEKVRLPKYAVKAILKDIPEETIWGFSNAVSYFRTHGDIRVRKGESFTSDLAFTLESLSGEILSLTPTIIDLKNKAGPITKELLLNPPKAVYK